MSRFKAAAIHFSISVGIVISIITLMLTLWYPHAYFKLMGGNILIYLIAGVDVFMGPLLTMVVFKTGKKSLKFDLVFIAVLQLAAMSYGLYVMFEARPIFTVFNQNAFYVASVVDIYPKELQKGKKKEWKTASIIGPRLVATIAPSKNDKTEAMFYEIQKGMKLTQQYPRFYDDYKNHQTEVVKAGKSLNELMILRAENKQRIDAFLQKIHRPINDFLYLPIYSAVSQMSAIIDAKSGTLVEIMDAKPIK